METFTINKGEEHVLTLKQLRRKYPQGGETIWLIKRCNHGFSTDEEFTAPSPTKCEDVLSYVKDLPIRAEVCVPPANAGKFLVFLLKKKKYLFWRRRSICSEEEEVFVLKKEKYLFWTAVIVIKQFLMLMAGMCSGTAGWLQSKKLASMDRETWQRY